MMTMVAMEDVYDDDWLMAMVLNDESPNMMMIMMDDNETYSFG